MLLICVIYCNNLHIILHDYDLLLYHVGLQVSGVADSSLADAHPGFGASACFGPE